MRLSPHISLAVLAALLAVSGCATTDDAVDPGSDPLEQGMRFSTSSEFRRSALEASVVDPSNGYSALRLQNYGLLDDNGQPTAWDALPEYNPNVRPVTTDDIGYFAGDLDRLSPEGSAFRALPTGVDDWTHDALMARGKEAFERYPLQIDRAAGALVQDAALVDEYGLWTDARGHIGGLVRVQLPGGGEGFAKTCSTCHARPDALGNLIHGASNANFDLGAALYRHAVVDNGGSPASVDDMLEWGAGQVDVTGDGVQNPTAITDLRPIRYQNRLNWAGTLHNNLPSLAVRVETLIITSLGKRQRPPHEISFAIAYYLWNLGERTPDDTGPDLTLPGAEVFDDNCAGCHSVDGTVIAPLPISAVGTEASVGTSPMRGVFNGVYRVPSLFKVGDRQQLLHHGGIDSLENLLSSERIETMPGHTFGTDLSADEKAQLIDFLETF